MKKKLTLWISCTIAVLIIFAAVLYITIPPILISNNNFINFIEKEVKTFTGADLAIKSPSVKTGLSISFKADEILLSKNNDKMLEIKDIDTKISLKEIFKNRIIVERFFINYIFADANKLMTLVPQTGEKSASKWSFDFYDSILGLKKGIVIYNLTPDAELKLEADKLFINNTKKYERFVHFNLDTTIKKSGQILHFAIGDNNRVIIKEKKLLVKDCVFNMNKSDVHINASASRQDGLNVNISSKKFNVDDIIAIAGSNLIINNGSEILSYFKDIKGNFDFDITLKRKDLSGSIDMNDLTLKVVPVADLPINVTGGKVLLTSKDITFKDFKGFYGTQKSNKITLNGIIKDYTKSCDTEVTVNTVATNEFAENYLSKLVGFPFKIIGNAGTKIDIKSIYNKIDIVWASKLAKGEDILVDGASLTPTGYDRAVQAKLHFENNILNINDISYYIASQIVKGSKVKPVLTLNGDIDLSKPVPFVSRLGFEIPNPLPSEFLNVLIGQKLFKGGKFYGKIAMVNDGTYPVVDGKLNAEKIIIPSQRVFVKSGEFYTDKNNIHIKSQGWYKRSKYDFSGTIANAIKYPVVIKNIDFGIDKIDIERVMKSFNAQNTAAVQEKKPVNTDYNYDYNNYDEESDTQAAMFDVNNLIIERCILRLNDGKYKDINFGNLKANLTLNKDNILELRSNRFDIAEGISSVKVFCDLKKHKYNITLGIKDVNSDIMSTSLLNLPREISGKSSGLIELNTDDSLKLNGSIKFTVKNGTIQKIGLIEYVLKFAAVFRNPIAMISPATISDMVNIPEGNFEKITGDLYLKNNVVELLKIKSSAPQLSSYIVGRYNIEDGDAILRIYTKFSNKNKGFAGILRNFSLNSLANRIPLSSRNDAHYYAAELEQLPPIDADEKDCQIFLTKVDGDVVNNNFLSSLKKIK